MWQSATVDDAGETAILNQFEVYLPTQWELVVEFQVQEMWDLYS